MEVKFKRLSKWAIMPTAGTEKAAGYDLYCTKDTLVMPGRNIIPTDIAVVLPPHHHADIRPRSGFSSKGFEGVTIQKINKGDSNDIANYRELSASRFIADVLLGTVDEDYRGSVGVIVKNDDVAFICKAGTRIAQMVVCPHATCEFVEVTELPETERSNKGFGSTGTN